MIQLHKDIEGTHKDMGDGWREMGGGREGGREGDLIIPEVSSDADKRNSPLLLKDNPYTGPL